MYYEDMKSNLRQEVVKLTEFLEKDISSETIDRIVSHCEFDSMKRNPMTNHLDVYSIDSKVSPLLRKGKYCKFGNFRENFIFENGTKRQICDVKNSQQRHDLPISVNVRVISPFYEGFNFMKLRICTYEHRAYHMSLRLKYKENK